MLCLSDNDVIHKLAACDLLDESLAALNVAYSDVYILPTAQYVLTKVVASYGAAITSRLNAFLSSVKVIDWRPPPDEIQLFEDTLGIYHGEAVLYASTAPLNDFIVVTGDKISLRALASTPKCKRIAERMAGHVFCLEQIIQKCINRFGFDAVKKKVVPARACDKTLTAIFGSGLTANPKSVDEGLTSYINDLRSNTETLLAL